MYNKYESFIINKARDLEVSLYNYYFLDEEIENCLLALSLYVNDDGGISNIDPDNLNNKSSLPSALYFMKLVLELNYLNTEDYFNDIICNVVDYLKKVKSFTYYDKTNLNKACSNKFRENKEYLHLEALTYFFITKYSTKNVLHIKQKLDEVIKKYLLLTPSYEEYISFSLIAFNYDNELLKSKIIDDAKLFINDYENDLSLLHINVIKKYNKECLLYKKYLLENTNTIGVWERKTSWGNDLVEEEVANIKYLSITLLNKLLFMKRVDSI